MDTPPSAQVASRGSSSPKAGLLMVVLGLVIGFVAGYGTGRVSTGTPLNPLSGGKGGYEEGYAAAVKKLEDSGLVPSAPTEATLLNGTISAVSEDSFTLETSSIAQNPLKESDTPKQRTVRITSATKILINVPRTPEENAKAQADFQKTVEAGTPGAPPSPFVAKAYEEKLKAGDLVIVEAGSNILNAASFEATTITVLVPSTATPAAATPPAGAPTP